MPVAGNLTQYDLNYIRMPVTLPVKRAHVTRSLINQSHDAESAGGCTDKLLELVKSHTRYF